MPADQTVLFYANSSPTLGDGHMMRLFALAQAFSKQGYQPHFLYSQCRPVILNKLQKAGFSYTFTPPSSLIDWLTPSSVQGLFIDDYEINSDDLKQLSDSEKIIGILDDQSCRRAMPVGLVINPAPDLTPADFSESAPAATFCLGPEFTFLREEFHRFPDKPLHERERILITLGGTDPKALSLPLAIALASELPSTPFDLILGHNFQPPSAAPENLTIHSRVDNMAALMGEAGLAVTAAGGTLGELASQGVPTISLTLFDNQMSAYDSSLNGSWYRGIDARHYSSESTVNADRFCRLIAGEVKRLWQSPARRQQMSNIARATVDAQGCYRIVRAFEKILLKG